MKLPSWLNPFRKDEWEVKQLPPNEEEQFIEIQSFKNGKYHRSVKLFYLTEEQLDELRNADKKT